MYGAAHILLWIVLAAGPSSQPSAAAQAAWGNLFAQPWPAEAEEQIQAVLKACDHDPNRVLGLIRADATYEPMKAGWQRRQVTVQDREGKKYDAVFFLRVPRDYSPARAWPLILAAHGQKGTGESFGKTMEQFLGAEVEQYVLVCPTMPGPKHYSGAPYQEQAYLRPLQWTQLKLNIDDDRVYITGYSQGGHSAWHLATMFPRHFAAAVPMAGIPWFEAGQLTHNMYLENLGNLPVWAIWGEKDTAPGEARGNVDFCRSAADRLGKLKNPYFIGTELEGKGHEWCWPTARAFLDFIRKQKRTPTPTRFEHRFHLTTHARGYYAEAVRLASKPLELHKPLRVPMPPGVPPTQQAGLAAMRRYLLQHLYEMDIAADPNNNSVQIRGRNVLTVRLHLPLGLLRPDREVTVKYWSRKWQGRPPVSAECLLRNYAEARDGSNLIWNVIDFTIGRKPIIKYDRGEH